MTTNKKLRTAPWLLAAVLGLLGLGTAHAAPPGNGDPEICDNGIDDDEDRKIDCADRDCRDDPACNDGGGEGGSFPYRVAAVLSCPPGANSCAGRALDDDDDVLVPKNTVFSCRELSHDQSVHIGKVDTWITFQNGPWTIHLALQQEGRFPDVDDVIPNRDSVTHHLAITPADAEFLSKSLRRLPDNDGFNHPVTVDLNGKVALRGTDNEHTTELILSGSNYNGEPLRWNTNRKYLARAVQLGLREISLHDEADRAVCYGDNCVYLWGLLSQEGCIPPDEKADRIESNSERNTVSTTHRNTRSPRITMTTQATPAKRNGAANVHSQGGESQNIEELIQQAEAVKASLRETTGQVSELIAALKRQRKQNRLVQSTLASLRQLQTIAG